MREVFTKNTFSGEYTGNRGATITPGWRKDTYYIEHKSTSDNPLSEAAALTLAGGIIGGTAICLVLMSLTYLRPLHFLALGAAVALAAATLADKKTTKNFKADCVLFLLLSILIMLINNYTAKLMADVSLAQTTRASYAVFLLFFGGAFLTLVSTVIVASFSDVLSVFWLLSLAWTVLASCAYYIGLTVSNRGWLSLIAAGTYGVKLLLDYFTAKSKLTP